MRKTEKGNFLQMVSQIQKVWNVAKITGGNKIIIALNAMQAFLTDSGIGVCTMLLFDGALMKNIPHIRLGCVLLVIITLYVCLGLPILSYLLERNTAKIQKQMTDHYFKAILKGSYSQMSSEHSGSLFAVFQDDIPNMMMMFDWNIVVLFQAILAGVGAILIMAVIYYPIAIYSLLMGSIIFTLQFFTRKTRVYVQDVQLTIRERMGSTIDLLNNLLPLRIHQHVKFLYEQIKLQSKSKKVQEIKAQTRISIVQSVQRLLTDIVFFAGMLSIGSIYIAAGKITFGQLMWILQLGNGVVFLFSSWTSYINNVQKAVVAHEHIEGKIEQSTLVLTTVQNAEPIFRPNTLIMQDITFCHPEHAKPIITELSLVLKVPGHLAICGDNGTGKSTLLKILMNLYQPKNGLLSVNGVPYSKISSEGFAKIITMVPQNVYICRGTIQNNILLGKKMDSSIFENILDIAGLSKWLKTLPNGLQTEVEEGGSNISKGQRQRIGIARCLSQHMPFLLLDEFETGLPIEMANEILEHIRNDTSMERSIIWVSHSEDLLNKADDILNLSTGEKHVH